MTFHCPTCGVLTQTTSTTEEPRDSNAQVATRTLALHQKLLNSNVAPEGAEVAFVRSVISKTGGRLEYFDDEIARLRNQLKELEEERAVLSSYHAQNNAILSPLRRMPPEVVGEIFSWTLPSASDALRDRFDIRRSPWVLTHISSCWRAVALSTPSLWSLIVISYSCSTYPLRMLETQLARARSLKIHLYGCEESDSRPQITAFECLAQHSASWELAIGLTRDLLPLLATLRGRLPSLRRLWISWDDSQSQRAVGSIDTFRIAPSLLDVGIYNKYHHVPLLLPTHQLTRYHHDAPWTVHVGILKMAPDLVEARLTVAFDDEQPWPEQDGIINLLHLQRLYVSHGEILRYLKTPGLQEIALHFYENDPDLLPDLESFVARSACNIHRVCFEVTPDLPTVREILHKYPSITELAILSYYPPDPDLDAESEAVKALIFHLTIPNSAGATVSPQLCAIEFGSDDKTSMDYALYLKMLQSRWRAQNCAFKSAVLLMESGPRPNSPTLNGLDSLRKDGLDLLLLYEDEAVDVMDRWTYNSSWT